MPHFPRAELQETVDRWLAANIEAARTGDWRPLADFFVTDGSYGWNIGPTDDVMCVGIDEIREIAFGQEMAGLLGWRYPYQRVLIDEEQGEGAEVGEGVRRVLGADGEERRGGAVAGLVSAGRHAAAPVAAGDRRRVSVAGPGSGARSGRAAAHPRAQGAQGGIRARALTIRGPLCRLRPLLSEPGSG